MTLEIPDPFGEHRYEKIYRTKLSILPRRCSISGERIPMFTKAVRCTKTHKFVHLPPTYEWYSESSFLFAQLRGEI